MSDFTPTAVVCDLVFRRTTTPNRQSLVIVRSHYRKHGQSIVLASELAHGSCNS